MTLYAALLYYPPGRYWLDPAEEHTAAGYATFFEAAAAAAVLRGGEALQPADCATTVTLTGGEGGEVRAVAGPATLGPDILGGFYLIEAASLDEAITWAVRIPACWRGKIELRPVVPMSNKPG